MKTVSIKTTEAERKWYVVDMEGQTLGRAAARIAAVLRGKHKATFTPNADTGDFVIVLNADKFVLTGNKLLQKRYYNHSGYMGGMKTTTVPRLKVEHPGEVIQRAVQGMLPRGPLGYKLLKKLKIYATGEHPHAAQTPEPLNLAKS
jgi:large subunit ribosomal protein L13